ncbi:MAG: CAP domain-containing protein [Prolixibacteraceae bacterium]
MDRKHFQPAGFLPGIILLASFILMVSCSKNQETEIYSSMDQEILQLINLHRISIGKVELTMNQTIWNEAKLHSTNMANGTVGVSHDGFADRIARIKAEIGGGSAGENVAYGFTTAQSVVDGWLSSSGHKANIEGDFTLTGISAVQNNSGSWYFTQIFLKK